MYFLSTVYLYVYSLLYSQSYEKLISKVEPEYFEYQGYKIRNRHPKR